MRGRAADVGAVAGVAAVVAAAMAAPVLLAPGSRVFGMEIAGRQHDPFTVMQQIAGAVTIGVYSQPITDLTGAALAHAAGPVAAYNGLVLISFPLSAAAAYALARYLGLSAVAAWFAALAYAFAPFHLAQAAYHPHVAQTQWMPLYLLALWRCMDEATPAAIGFLVAAAAAVTLSNFYGGLIAGVLTPVAMAAHWRAGTRAEPGSIRGLPATIIALASVGCAGVAFAW